MREKKVQRSQKYSPDLIVITYGRDGVKNRWVFYCVFSNYADKWGSGRIRVWDDLKWQEDKVWWARSDSNHRTHRVQLESSTGQISLQSTRQNIGYVSIQPLFMHIFYFHMKQLKHKRKPKDGKKGLQYVKMWGQWKGEAVETHFEMWYLYLVKGELNAYLRSTVFSITMTQQAFLSAVTYQSNWCSINCVI